MSEHAKQPEAVGWYPDPDGRKGMERYWNGTAWSGAPRRKPPSLSWKAVSLMLVGTVLLSAMVWWLVFS